MVGNSKGRKITVHSGNTPVGHFIGTGDDLQDLKESERVLREAGVRAAELSGAERARRQALAFANVAVELAKKIAELRGHSADYAAPFLVNAAFAIEVFLKALAKAHGSDLRGHSLLKLFDDLPKKARQAIDSAFSAAPPELIDFEGSDDLRGMFGNLDDAFTSWRYIYERQGDGRFYGAKAALLLLAVLDDATRE